MAHDGKDHDGCTHAERQAAGHLLTLLDDHDFDPLIRAVAYYSRTGRTGIEWGEPGFGGILRSLVATIADVLVQPLGWSRTAAVPHVTFGGLDGDDPELARTPPSVRWVARAVAAEVDGDPDAAHAAIADAAAADEDTRTDTLLEAVTLLGKLLDARLRYISAE